MPTALTGWGQAWANLQGKKGPALLRPRGEVARQPSRKVAAQH